MLVGVSTRALDWVSRVMRAQVISVDEFRLGGWHVNHRLTVTDAYGATEQVVLRRWARPDWQVEDPDYTAAREAHVLALLAPTPLPTPQEIAADPDGINCGVPALLLTYLPGQPPSTAIRAGRGFCRQLAETLAQIHALGLHGQRGVPGYRLYFDRLHAVPPTWLPDQPTWQHATRILHTATPEPPPTLIHRDFHPENTLWSGRRLTGVVDWTQASWGPAALDLAHLRWNLALDHSFDLADEFLACYRAVTGSPLSDQPYWDLVAVFDLLGDDPSEPGDLNAQDQQRLTDYVHRLISRTRRHHAQPIMRPVDL